MAAKTTEELKRAFRDDARAAQFGRAFLDAYLVPAFGVLSKSEIDLRVFALLVEAGAIDPEGPIFNVARALNVTPAKARSLIFQYQLRHITEADTDAAVLKTLGKARFWTDGSNLAFGVESPLIRAAIAAKMRERGVFADVSLSGDILKVSPDQFGEAIALLLPADAATALAKKLKKEGVNEGKVRLAIKRLGKEAAEEYLKDQAKEALPGLLTNLGRLAIDRGPGATEYLSTAINGFL